ncbi:MAG: hypothetical protein Q9220_003819 [cf. Caloplaca sp. 1 TL-2023]
MAAARQVFGAVQRRAFSVSSRQASKVAVLGGAGGIGQPLSLLMKLNPRVTELALYDIKGAPGVAADIGHINTKSVVTGYKPDNDGLKQCLTGAEIVLIPAGVPRKPGMTRDDLFNTNASIVRDLAKAVADAAPEANTLVISNPVNSTVPICAEIFKSKGMYNPKRLFGVTTLDVVRASRFISQHKSTDPADENITVIGGHSGATIVPLLSQSGYSLSGKDLEDYIYRVQFGGDEVVKAKDGAGSATLSMAMAGARFAESLLKAAQGQKGVIEPTFVESPLYKDQGIDFFASRVELGPNGVEKIHDVGKVTAEEQKLLDACLKDLKGNIAKGVKSSMSSVSECHYYTTAHWASTPYNTLNDPSPCPDYKTCSTLGHRYVLTLLSTLSSHPPPPDRTSGAPIFSTQYLTESIPLGSYGKDIRPDLLSHGLDYARMTLWASTSRDPSSGKVSDDAAYGNIIDTAQGIIIAIENNRDLDAHRRVPDSDEDPEDFDDDEMMEGEGLPWSEIIYQTWHTHARPLEDAAFAQRKPGYVGRPSGDLLDFKYSVQHRVENPQTQSIIKLAYQSNGFPLRSSAGQGGEEGGDEEWRKWTQEGTPNWYFALLGTDNCKGTVWLLNDHAGECGGKAVREVWTRWEGVYPDICSGPERA